MNRELSDGGPEPKSSNAVSGAKVRRMLQVVAPHHVANSTLSPVNILTSLELEHRREPPQCTNETSNFLEPSQITVRDLTFTRVTRVPDCLAAAGLGSRQDSGRMLRSFYGSVLRVCVCVRACVCVCVRVYIYVVYILDIYLYTQINVCVVCDPTRVLAALPALLFCALGTLLPTVGS